MCQMRDHMDMSAQDTSALHLIEQTHRNLTALLVRAKKGEIIIPFKEVYSWDIGDALRLGYQPLSYVCQVLSILYNPSLIEHADLFPEDVVRKALRIQSLISSNPCSYFLGYGNLALRQIVARHFSLRDRLECGENNIIFTDGSTTGVRAIITALVSSKTDCVMIPCPKFFLYHALVAELGGSSWFYYLDEHQGWDVTIDGLERAIRDARNQRLRPVAMIVNNPHNPTGAVLSVSKQDEILRFCFAHNLVIIADEVYGDNTYEPFRPFSSFRKVKSETKLRTALATVSSGSKGRLLCPGFRAGIMTLDDVPNEVMSVIQRLPSLSLGSSSVGQLATALLAEPPQKGDKSFPLYEAECEALESALRINARLLYSTINGWQGVHCQRALGALFAFPRIDFPSGFLALARVQKVSPDALYCERLAMQTGVLLMPGCQFGDGSQRGDGCQPNDNPARFHIRIAIFDKPERFRRGLHLWENFHEEFYRIWSQESHGPKQGTRSDEFVSIKSMSLTRSSSKTALTIIPSVS
eukprot:Gregarina_sp_Poly_1__2183@NODE_1580_length_3798_cov_35_889306_g1044_i0_p1_GENE_NODE_1580_length_3798_cov_35_889306_g1044_i0NODE_1580_length_3798_cov_35_889306_g1044_i0_p1_ORF_typecomplete_len525_score44_39Aminotran_1_2/PF00155_21/5_2e55Aminotran_5/PF00266_19/0_012Beta_elim_lyase/PF01212_21/0_026OKR_DC_1/PF01276_20/0_039_NODE_1580_length_3798_cov_35_889306_g1044_i013152889